MTPAQLQQLGGRTLEGAEAEKLRAQLPGLPAALLSLLVNRPLVGAKISVDPAAERSGLGVEMQWMTPSQMEDEATEAYPGIVAVPRGYVPIGICLEGSGDPYFFRVKDGAVVRIPHDAAAENDLDESRIELVAESVDQLLEAAE